MKCPNCTSTLEIDHALDRVTTYGESVLVSAPCCSIGLRVKRIISFDIIIDNRSNINHEGKMIDDWGIKIGELCGENVTLDQSFRKMIASTIYANSVLNMEGCNQLADKIIQRSRDELTEKLILSMIRGHYWSHAPKSIVDACQKLAKYIQETHEGE